MNQGRIWVAGPSGLSGLVAMLLLLAGRVGAHDWHRHDEPPASPAPAAAKMRLRSLPKSATPQTSARADLLARTFVRFQPSVRFWWNAESFMVGSDGMPAHGMMEGITAWQRQIPVPTYYFGTNQWRLPVEPVEAARRTGGGGPLSTHHLADLFAGSHRLGGQWHPDLQPGQQSWRDLGVDR